METMEDSRGRFTEHAPHRVPQVTVVFSKSIFEVYKEMLNGFMCTSVPGCFEVFLVFSKFTKYTWRCNSVTV